MISLIGDGAAFYVNRLGADATIERGTSVADPAALTRVVTAPRQRPETYDIALGASRVAYLDTEGPSGMLHVRGYARSGSRIAVGADSKQSGWWLPISIDGDRQLARTGTEQTDGKLWLRTRGAPDRGIFAPTARPYWHPARKMSMNCPGRGRCGPVRTTPTIPVLRAVIRRARSTAGCRRCSTT